MNRAMAQQAAEPMTWGAKRRPADAGSRALLAVLILLTLLLYGHDFTHSLPEFTDANHHLMNGIFVHDALHEPIRALSDPVEYAFNYYRHYPAVNIGYYPPVFPLFEAGFMLLFGVSGATGQLTVLAHAVLLTVFAFAWFRMRLPGTWAAGATVLLVAAPYLVYWGRDIMLEVPVLAFAVGSVWMFERLLDDPRPSWRAALAWALLTTLALWTKQHALMFPFVFLIATVLSRRWKQLTHPPLFTATIMVGLASAGLVLVMLRQGGDAVGHSIGFTAQHVADRFNWYQWRYYIDRLPRLIAWPVLIAAGLGVVVVILRRIPRSAFLFVWIAVFYLMHSYFKAQDTRYAILVMPPVVLLAALGLYHAIPRRGPVTDDASLDNTLAPAALPGQHASPKAHRAPLGATLIMIGLLGYTLYGAAQVRMPRVHPAYERAASDLCAAMDSFSCLTFLAQNANRPAILHRLAVDENRTADRGIFSFGRILRAHQILRGWRDTWPDVAAMDRDLKSWNVKYLLLESPGELNELFGDVDVNDAIRALLDQGDFRVLREYAVDLTAPRHPVPLSRTDFPQRTLTIYERISPIEFNPGASPPIRPKRVPLVIPETTAD